MLHKLVPNQMQPDQRTISLALPWLLRIQREVMPGNLNAPLYRDTILQPHFVTFVQYHGGTFQQDNARPHVARVVTQYLQQQNVPVLPWSANSPDLSSIEQIWDEMQAG